MDPGSLLATLHDNPETEFEVERTAGAIRGFLAEAGLEPLADDVAGHGLLYVLEGQDADGAPLRFWRAELDALPNGHRCGHDGHMTMLAAAVRELSDRDDWHGRVIVLFQPAEETGEGMSACLQHPDFPDTFDEGIAIHNLPDHPKGQVVLGPGCLASTGLRLDIRGETSHAAEPEAGRSPWPQMLAAAEAAGQFTDAQQGLATTIHMRLGEEAYGTSPGVGVIAFTIRAEKEERVEEICKAIQQAAQGRCDVDSSSVEPFPAVHNDPGLLDTIEKRCRDVGLDVSHREKPLVWSEDFGHADRHGPVALVGLGSGRDQAPLHDSNYRFPKAVIKPGVRFWLAQAGARP